MPAPTPRSHARAARRRGRRRAARAAAVATTFGAAPGSSPSEGRARAPRSPRGCAAASTNGPGGSAARVGGGVLRPRRYRKVAANPPPARRRLDRATRARELARLGRRLAAAASRALSPASELKWKSPASSRSLRRARTSALSCASGSRPRWPRARAITSSAHALPPGGGGTSATIGRRRAGGDGRHRGVAAVTLAPTTPRRLLGDHRRQPTPRPRRRATAVAPAPHRARAAAARGASCDSRPRRLQRARADAPRGAGPPRASTAARAVRSSGMREEGVQDVAFAHGVRIRNVPREVVALLPSLRT